MGSYGCMVGSRARARSFWLGKLGNSPNDRASRVRIPHGRITALSAQALSFRELRLCEVQHSPGPIGRAGGEGCSYRRILCFLRTELGVRYESESRPLVLGGGMRDGRLNDELIVLPRRAPNE